MSGNGAPLAKPAAVSLHEPRLSRRAIGGAPVAGGSHAICLGGRRHARHLFARRRPKIWTLAGARSLYGFTKLAAEQLIEEYRATYGLKAVVNRCGVIAGPWQFGKVDQGVAALWVLAHHFGRPLSYIGYGGAGKQVRDFLHVADLCDLVIEQIQSFDEWEGWVGNVAGGPENTASLQELTALCEKSVGRPTRIASNPVNRPNDLRIFVADCSRLFQRTAWRPRRTVAQIIGDLSRWVAENADTLQKL